MGELLSTPDFWMSLLALSFLEIILGIDNLVFISIAAERAHEAKRNLARHLGLWLAFLLRLIMLAGLVWLSKLTLTVFSWPDFLVNWIDPKGLTPEIREVSFKDIVMIVGGLFLLAKGTWEIHESLEGDHEGPITGKPVALWAVVLQISVVNLVFSLDSIITAVGMTQYVSVMVLAVVISTFIMVAAMQPVSAFINRHPTSKMLALSFILLVGVSLIADGFGVHIPRGYLYFAIAFSLLVETLNIMVARRRHAQRKKNLPLKG